MADLSATVNANLAASQASAVETVPSSFDTSEADNILSGLEPGTVAPTVVPQQVTEPVTSQETQQAAPTLTTEQLEALRAQLAPTTTEESPKSEYTFSDDYVSADAKFKETTGLDLGTAIDKYMQGRFGVSLEDAVQSVQYTSTYVQQRQGLDQVDQATSQLKATWGNNYDVYINLAKEEYAKLPEGDLKKSLDNAQGAQLLLDRALLNKNNPTGLARSPVTPSANNFGTAPKNVTVGQQPTLRSSQLLNMSDAEFYSPDIQNAIMSGLVFDDIQ